MKVRLTRPNRIERGHAGDIVEVSPDRAAFLLQYGLADPVIDRERVETPETRKAEAKTEKAPTAKKAAATKAKPKTATAAKGKAKK